MGTKFYFRSVAVRAASAVLLTVAAARAANVPVVNTNDKLAGSLRQAIVNAQPGDTVVFNIPKTEPGYNATTGVFTITLTSEPLTVSKDLTIDSGGQRIAVQRSGATGTPNFRIFLVTNGNVMLSGLTISNGNATSSDGLSGGGIRNAGANLTVVDCAVVNNNGSSFGGGIINAGGNLTVNRCTLSNNSAINGGGIINFGNTVSVMSSTFYGNLSTNGDGGGISQQGQSLTVFNSTISGNSAAGRGGGISTSGATPTHVRDTIIAANTTTGVASSVDVFGAFISDGYNFIGDFNNQASGFGLSGSHDQVGNDAAHADPKLGALQDNGGLTKTMRPLPGSPLIDQGTSGGLTMDQRGYSRVQDQPLIANAADGSDIGAAEVGLPQPGPTFTVTNTDQHSDEVCSEDDCTLLEAVNAANRSASSATIIFAPGLSGMIANTIVLAGVQITRALTIVGPGARLLTITGNGSARIFNVASSATATISGVTLLSGNTQTTGLSDNSGGAVENFGTLALQNCTFVGNAGGSGGAVANLRGLTVNNCTFDNNRSTGHGGALRNGGSLTVTNSTFYHNTGQFSGAIASFASAAPNATATVTNCTVAANTAAGPGSSGGGLSTHRRNRSITFRATRCSCSPAQGLRRRR